MPSFISWIPTQLEYIHGFFEVAPVSSLDVVYDLGCGDGRLLFAALEKGAGKAVGIDIDPERITSARNEAEKKGLEDKVTFLQGDVLDADLSGASVIFCYLISAASAALKPKFEKELKPGTRVVMESFPVPGWKVTRNYTKDHRSFFLYIMPPKHEK